MDDLAPLTPLLKPSALYNIRHTAAEPAKPPWLCLPQRVASGRLRLRLDMLQTS